MKENEGKWRKMREGERASTMCVNPVVLEEIAVSTVLAPVIKEGPTPRGDLQEGRRGERKFANAVVLEEISVSTVDPYHKRGYSLRLQHTTWKLSSPTLHHPYHKRGYCR